MSSWLIRLADVVWTSVFAVLFAITAILFAIFLPNAVALAISLAGTSITLALLAQKE